MRFIAVIFAASILASLPALAATTNSTEGAEAETPREFFNAGTKLLQQSNLWRAEYCFEHALASQSEKFQSPSLYNLGHVRFTQGAEELKKGPPAGPSTARARAASNAANQAIRSTDDALAAPLDAEIEKLVASYQEGRGTRKELKAALKAIKLALQVCGKTLNKWERSSGDFKSSLELTPADTDARHNAEVVDRHIAKLIDSIKQMEQMASAMGKQEKELGDKLQQLKGRIPAPNMPPGAAGEDDEEEESPFGKEPGDRQEGPSKDGKEIQLSPEQASWLLEALGSGKLLLPAEPGKGGTPRSKDPW